MMWRLALAFLTFAAAAQAARADDTFDAFRQLCVATHADEAAALAAAEGAGWMPLPQMFIDQFPKGQFLEPKGRLRTSNTAMMMLIVAHGLTPIGNIEAHVCGVAAVPGNNPALEQQAAALANVPKDSGLDNMYIWREENGAHIQVQRNSPDLRSFVESGAVNFLMTRDGDKMSMVVLVVPSK